MPPAHLENSEAQALYERAYAVLWIKSQMAHLGLTYEHLRAAGCFAAPGVVGDSSSGVVRFRDAGGHAWDGVGGLPERLQRAVNAGQSIEYFRVEREGQLGPKAVPTRSSRSTQAKAVTRKAARNRITRCLVPARTGNSTSAQPMPALIRAHFPDPHVRYDTRSQQQRCERVNSFSFCFHSSNVVSFVLLRPFFSPTPISCSTPSL